ncbi:hypothetical protein WICMUC_002160 [Wickerhamomyces mucosus]|uniref:Increased recombination centers protein 22 n=1 Tax=Wickerhamomyces mucosus TaxID=1378264 RepID=A0A9P8PPQ2_9ASCO|nr:hypothetical protein WICMUC_002160 [Wickerhamomyces mucosus]
MRIATLLSLSATFLATSVFAQAEQAPIDLANPGDSADGKYIDPDELDVGFLYDISYNLVDKPDSDVQELFNGEVIILNYTFHNFEQEEVSIVGVGGQFVDPTNGQTLANITDANIGPVIIPPGDFRVFQQRVGINLPENNYLLAPGLYIVRGSQLALIGTRTQLTIVSEKPISLFNPQFLLLELLLVVTLGVAGYFAYTTYGVDYFQTTAKTAKVQPASPSADSAVDQSWLPEGHVKKLNKRKAK